VKKKAISARAVPPIEQLIREVRGRRVLLDADLAATYGVETKVLNRAVKRNRDRFPEDFLFQLTATEWGNLKRQIGTSSSAHGGRRTRPYAFTEHGALQAANVLNSPRAVQMSVFVIRAFIKMRETLQGTRGLARKLVALEKKLTGRLDSARSCDCPRAPGVNAHPQPASVCSRTSKTAHRIHALTFLAHRSAYVGESLRRSADSLPPLSPSRFARDATRSA
jgi:hypothetical protein